MVKTIPLSELEKSKSNFRNIYYGSNGHVPKIWPYPASHILQAIKMLEDGDSFNTLDRIVNTPNPLKSRKIPNNIDNFITKIKPPDIYCAEDSVTDNPFDFIDIEVNFIKTFDNKTAGEYIKSHLREIFEKVINKLLSSKGFTKHGVPINYLTCEPIIRYKDHSIFFKFSFKEFPDLTDFRNLSNKDSDQKNGKTHNNKPGSTHNRGIGDSPER